jgi:hypothetical protein
MLEKEKNFDKHGELRKLGGKVYDFFPDDGKFSINSLIDIRDQKKLALRLAYTTIL